jgi:hypothetical protein
MAEVIVSIDIESDGPAPGLNSMLALGAAAFSQDDTELDCWYYTLDPLPGASRNPETMAWWKTQPEAWAEVTSSTWNPVIAVPLFARWCESLPGKAAAVAWPAAFDFAFVNYYLHRFNGSNPLGFSCLDIGSYARGLGMPVMHGDLAHNALGDARKQGQSFLALRRHANREATEPAAKGEGHGGLRRR